MVQNAGSERCCEALQKLRKHYDIVVNIQGDEPLIEPEIIDGVVMALQVVMNSSFFISYSSDKQNVFPEVTEMKSSEWIVMMCILYLCRTNFTGDSALPLPSISIHSICLTSLSS